MEKNKTNTKIRKNILLIFVIALVISITSSGIIVFANWISSSKVITEQLATDINENIHNKVYDFMQAPYNVNEINHKIIENNMLDLSDDKQRNKFFVGVVEMQKQEIYSFSYGTVTGEYYGAHRNEEGEIEIIICSEETDWNAGYYSINEDGTPGELVFQVGKFDPRTRAWYIAAVQNEGAVYSPIYKHFVKNDLAVSAAWPVYDEHHELKGVMGVHLLLSDISKYLKDAVSKYNGMAIIIEKDSHYLIANSLEIADFNILPDETLIRYTPEDLDNEGIQKSYEHYKEQETFEKVYKGKSGNYFVDTKEITLEGINWIVMTAIPESIFMKDVTNSMFWSAFAAIISLIFLLLIYNFFMKRYLQPVKDLLQISGEMSAGDLRKRIKIVKHNEIGLISQIFNDVADKMESLIDNLDDTVQQRTEELQKTYAKLAENKGDLQLILDSAAEAIYGIDLQGNCTFCNKSCLKMLGYNYQTELLGKNMHWLIHHSHKDKTPMPIEECKIYNIYHNQEGSHVDDEVFWRADGTCFDAEYYSYPQIKNEIIVGIVVTFTDISKRKQKEAKIEYLSYYDALTGFQNRSYFEKNRIIFDKPENLPLSVIFADINGLKMTNDIFGHAAGDELIKESAKILKKVCRQDDLIARIGGDEFVILLPKTTKEEVSKVLARIDSEFETARVEVIKCSISAGAATKTSSLQPLDEVMGNAENAMYKDKTLNRKNVNKDIIDTIVDNLHLRNLDEKRHSIDVSNLCVKVGLAMKLPENEISKLKRAAYLHDIGKIVLDEGILRKDYFTEEEKEKIKQHSAVGYRILNLFDDTLDLAEYIYGHHERWDGSGYPRGLKKEQIPLISRIIQSVETYDRVLHRGELPLEERKIIARNVINAGGGTQFDPKVAAVLVQVIDEENKGD
ncbi:MAG TPA: diguanylate cyclase [Bacilli bacterium]|nr:diguanylate cyclase [Bacilli bacterium]